MTKGTTVRFRADAGDVRALRRLSKRLHLPVSSLLRTLVQNRYVDLLLADAYKKKGPKKVRKSRAS